jgi:hypothetical protein
MLKEELQANFDTTAISAQTISFTSFNEKGMEVEADQIIVLDSQDRFMFLITPDKANEYMFDGYVDYDKIYKDYILTKKQWDELVEARNLAQQITH